MPRLSSPRSLGETAPAALIVDGSVVVLVGEMRFHVWGYAVSGPGPHRIGMLCGLVTRRSQRPA